MKGKINTILGIIILLSMLLTACGGAPAATEAPQAPAATEVPPEPTAVVVEAPAEPEVAEPEFSEADLDAAYADFLAGLQAYGTLGMDAFNTMLMEEQPFVLDVRKVDEVQETGHIPGAVLVPLAELGKNTDKLPAFDEQVVTYCKSGWRCTIAMTGLGALGWDVLSLKDNSFTGWVEKGFEVEPGLPEDAPALNAAEPDPGLLQVVDEMFSNMPEGYGGINAENLNTALVESPDLVLIDVRTEKEVAEKGFIPFDNAINIPLEDFIAKKDAWPQDKDGKVAIYCGSGHRSTIAMTMLWTYGYTDVTSLQGGFAAWTAAGLPAEGAPAADPTAKLDAAYNTFLAGMEAYDTLSLEAFNTSLMETPPFILDVRNASEVEELGHIEGAVLIPTRDLAKNLDKLPSFDTPIVTYCKSGWRCTIALTALEALGWQNVKALKGNSFTGWVDAGYPVVAGLPAEAAVLNAASPDAALVTLMDNTLMNLPENWGGISPENFNLAMTENPDLIVIDVRTATELAEKGVIEWEGRLDIPLEEFVTRKAEWPADKDAPIVVYCGSGHRSTIAMTMLYSYGYTKVESLQGGFDAWVKAGLPVVEYVAP